MSLVFIFKLDIFLIKMWDYIEWFCKFAGLKTVLKE